MANTRFTFKEATEKREIVAYHAAMSFTSYNRDWCVNHKDEEGWYFLDNANRCPIEFYEAVKEFQPYGSRFYGLERAKNIKKDVGWFKNKGFVVSEKAIEDIFGVTVIKVNTINVRGKEKRTGAYPKGYSATWKKAVVKLSADSKNIEIFEGVV